MFSSYKQASRLGQWDGRRRSSRSDEPAFPDLWHRPVLLRLGLVLTTLLASTLLAYFSGPPLPYRKGAIYPSDLRVRAYFEVYNQARTERARLDAVDALPPAQRDDPEARRVAKNAVAPVVDK